ncbi:MAG TPA: HAD-IIA family hydrolase [Abditibacteriaceae bacterium]|jgi:phosphoglycolate/pyridoxal phosphate phosphatase family enzyme
MNEAFLSHLDAFIFDLDGVIWKGNAPIAGAVESVMRLRAAGKKCLYCTNNSRRTSAEFAGTLRALGIECDEDDVMTSATATALYVQSLFTGGCSAYVVGEEGLVQAIRRTGAIVMTSPIIPQRSDLHDNHGAVDCVIVGLDASFTYHKLRVAQRLIMGGARFIATNRDSTFPTPYGLVPGAGSIIAAIETATGTQPVTLGKPQPLMARLLIQKFGLDPARTAMIGDRLDTDIVSARRAQITAVFVATGVHSREMATRAKNEQKPDAIFDDLPALCDVIFAPGIAGTVESAAIGGALVAGAVVSGVALHETFSDETPLEAEPSPVAAEALGDDEFNLEPVVAQEPAKVLETPFALETQAEPAVEETLLEPETPSSFVLADSILETPADEALVLETAPAEDPAPLEFSFNDEVPVVAAEPETPAAPVADADYSFDFASALDDIDTVAPATNAATPEAPAAEAPMETATEEAQDEEKESVDGTKISADDKWWETLDNAV